ncbi:MAG TPA: 2-phospho-L-lactate guanylyltransferase [Methanobacterium sp.]|nr:2-phospho-L-lactate guanylyltransferase [Methanobacterium sp.]
MTTCAIIPVSRFSNAKTRLSPTLTPLERENLLKSMLSDVINVLKNSVDQVLVISSDRDVLKYVDKMDVHVLEEEGVTDLNGALAQAIEYSSKNCSKVLIIPSDIPLIKEEHVKEILKMGKDVDLVIAPAKGGGTNALLCTVPGIKMMFGDCSFFKHLDEAVRMGLKYYVYDSFYLSLDVNTAEDLGEIMLHGENTFTYQYLQELSLKVRSNHGMERLKVLRD